MKHPNSKSRNTQPLSFLKKYALAIIPSMMLAEAFLILFLVRTLASTAHPLPTSPPAPSPSAPPGIPGKTAPVDEVSTPLLSATTLPPTPLAAGTPPAPSLTPIAFFEGPIIYGTSYGGRALRAYRLGTGPSTRFIIGGIHGGYEWNTVELVSQTLIYLQQHPALIPAGVTLYLVPCANPDGYAAGTDPVVARMNDNGVDLNRNWDYQWQMTATHGTRPVKAGARPFSEPETAALRDFLLGHRVELAIFYHSAVGKIFSGADRTRSATYQLAEAISEATGYPHAPEGMPGQITTGDAIDWLSTQGIAAIEVELTTHQDLEWERNLRGILAFLDWSLPGQSPAVMPVQGQFITYTVQAGDSLGSIALKYDVSLEDLTRVNRLIDADVIVEGQLLLIPVSSQ